MTKLLIVNILGAIAAYCMFPENPCVNVQRTFDTQIASFWIRRTHVKLVYELEEYGLPGMISKKS